MLTSRGHQVTSRWLRDGHGLDYQPKHNAIYAHIDIEDIEKSDLIIAYNPLTSTKGGTYFELGYSFARSKRIVLVGSLSGTVFEDLFSTFEDFKGLVDILEI